MVGAGFMGQGLTNQIDNSVPGHAHGGDLQPTARSEPIGVYALLGRRGRVPVDTQADVRRRRRRRASRSSPRTRSCCAAAPEIDVLVDVTGSVEFGAHVILEAFAHGKPSC